MLKACYSCNRKALRTIKRSHSHIGTISRQELNLQSRKIDGKRVLVCVKCIKEGARAK